MWDVRAAVPYVQKAAKRGTHFKQDMASADVRISQTQIGFGRATYN
jgi:hypothetical protein